MAEQARSLKVFVSYSPADEGLADQLILALEDKGFNPILDRRDISGDALIAERQAEQRVSVGA